MTADEVYAKLRALNPQGRPDQMRIYAGAYVTYREAETNIAERGAINSHPRTGSPLENPYLKVRSGAAATLKKIRLKTGDLWD